MIKLTQTDGGKMQAGFPEETNDCGVRSLALSTGISYGDAHDMLRERGRKNRRGTKTAWIESSLTSLASIGIKWAKAVTFVYGGDYNLNKKYTLAQFISTHKTGRYLVVTNRHGLALIDGVVHDAGQISGARCRVLCAYKIELPAVPSAEKPHVFFPSKPVAPVVPAPAVEVKPEITQVQINSLWERLNKLEGKL
jgi:hypothetical protein